jgi:hypothetical protein
MVQILIKVVFIPLLQLVHLVDLPLEVAVLVALEVVAVRVDESLPVQGGVVRNPDPLFVLGLDGIGNAQPLV